jgi:signal transduction histidine kinase
MTTVTHLRHRAAAPAPPAPDASRAAVAEVEAERAAIARLLHDDVMQTLIAARWLAERAGDTTVRDAVRDALTEAGAALWRLRPRTVEGRLVRALDELVERHDAIVVAVRAEGVPDVLDVAVATVAYRVVQAALDASAASTVDVRVDVRGGVLTVSMCDDGPSYEDTVNAPESELTRWLARAGTLGGRARVADSPAGGTTLWLEIPNALPKEPDA